MIKRRIDKIFIPVNPKMLDRIEWRSIVSQSFHSKHLVQQTLEKGQDAWKRIKKSPRKQQSYRDWQALIDAYEVGEELCESLAGKRQGGRYNRLLSAWLKSHGFDDIPSATRTYMRNVGKHQGDIEVWRSTKLTPEVRMKLNNPKTVWQHYERWRKWKKD